jgi:uncharacterized membrane protein YphA (DoxX/SURF4 family)
MKSIKYLTWLLTAVRMLVGWHFLYEGIVKMFDPGWSSAAYLAGSHWLFSGFFHWIVVHPSALAIADFANIWGLTLIGIALILGLFIRVASAGGILLLALYYIANPPIPGSEGLHGEGSYLLVNRNLIELAILVLFVLIPSIYSYGIDRLIKYIRVKSPKGPSDKNFLGAIPDESVTRRRELLKNLASLPVLGIFGLSIWHKHNFESIEDKLLLEKPDAVSGATLMHAHFADLKELKGQVPKGKIGKLEVSRLIAGGNLIGGWAHARDLIYASALVKAYHTDERIIETLRLAEQCGVNSLITNPALNRIILKYWKQAGGKIQFISDCGVMNDLKKGIQISIDAGASACYIQGGIGDQLVAEGKFDLIASSLELIRKNGLPAGIGGHKLATVQGCVEKGLLPDFWVKTLHHHNYWSARPGEKEMDNIFCDKPQETIDFMATLKQPWIAYKVLAAGAIEPKDGFPYAFNNGADFICVGMYDFQVVEDVNLALEVLSKVERTRSWMA